MYYTVVNIRNVVLSVRIIVSRKLIKSFARRRKKDSARRAVICRAAGTTIIVYKRIGTHYIMFIYIYYIYK